jgi:type II secretory pathway pseudopilin PulG
MIELIFAIVIMGIALMSAPILISTASKSSMVALQQESIAAIVSQMNMILTAEWDHMDTNATIGEPVLQTDSTVFNQCTGGATRPNGVTSSSGRYCLGLNGSGPYTASSIGTDSTIGESISYDDVDDYHNQSYSVNIYAGDTYATHLGDYIDKNISIASNIYYGDDTPRDSSDATGNYQKNTTFSNPFRHNTPGGTTNIKLIHVQLTSVNPSTEIADKQINLSAFMCNVGAPKPIINNESSL